MIEMLGVLAIVGVLSVGGIAGYSKAMTKYKINKMVDEYTMLMIGLMEHQENLFKNRSGNYYDRFLAQFIKDAKLVPETWKLLSNYTITDSLGNQLTPYINTAKTGMRFSADIYITHSGINKDSDFAYQLCLALANDVVYSLSSTTDYISIFIMNDVITNEGDYMVYSKSCYNSKCLSEMTLSEISTICKSCVAKNTCNVGMSWR